MPGVFGLAGTGPIMSLDGTLQAMAERMRHHPWYEQSLYRDEAAGVAMGRMALGFVNTAPQPAFNEDRSIVAVMDGELYDFEVQRQRLACEGHRFQSESQAEVLIHGYESRGKEFFRSLHGKFVAAIWDARAQRLILANDRFGMRPLFYAQLAGRLLFASEIKALLTDPNISRRPDLRGVAQFFTYGHLLGQETLLEAVHLLPAAGWLTYDVKEDRLALDRYWKLQTAAGADGRSEQDVLDRIDQAFGDAVKRCIGGTGHLGLSLSGGLDARTILGAIDVHHPLTSVSLGVEGSMDHRCAAELARLTGREHHQVFLGTDFLRDFEQHLSHMVHLTDGQYMSQCIVMPTLPVYRDLGIQVLLRGHAGELMHMRKAYNFSLDDEALGLRDEAGLEGWLSRHLQTFMLEGIGDTLFAPAFRAQMQDLARESLRSCLRESAGTGPPVHRIWHLFLNQRSRRETATSLVKFGSLVETRLPYLDNELVDALFAAPPELKLEEKIQAHILRRRMPAFLKVLNVNTGARMQAGRLGQAFGRLRQKILAKLGVKGYQPYERLGLWLRRELRPLVTQTLLSERCLGRGIFDPQTVRNVLDQHMSGGNHTFLIMAMLIFETGQRQFIDREAGSSRVSGKEEVCLPV
jgi:asparagine synthase (glutamine-hydrolysing)